MRKMGQADKQPGRTQAMSLPASMVQCFPQPVIETGLGHPPLESALGRPVDVEIDETLRLNAH